MSLKLLFVLMITSNLLGRNNNGKTPRVFFDNGKAFFELGGNAIMKLSPRAAIEVCQEATKRNL